MTKIVMTGEAITAIALDQEVLNAMKEFCSTPKA